MLKITWSLLSSSSKKSALASPTQFIFCLVLHVLWLWRRAKLVLLRTTFLLKNLVSEQGSCDVLSECCRWESIDPGVRMPKWCRHMPCCSEIFYFFFWRPSLERSEYAMIFVMEYTWDMALLLTPSLIPSCPQRARKKLAFGFMGQEEFPGMQLTCHSHLPDGQRPRQVLSVSTKGQAKIQRAIWNSRFFKPFMLNSAVTVPIRDTQWTLS